MFYLRFIIGGRSPEWQSFLGGPGSYIYCNDNNIFFLGGGGGGSWAFLGEASTPQIP